MRILRVIVAGVAALALLAGCPEPQEQPDRKRGPAKCIDKHGFYAPCPTRVK